MSNSLCNATLAEIKRDITAGLLECSRRGLVHSVKWLAELKHGMSPVAAALLSATVPITPAPIATNEQDAYDLAKSYFDIREYDRAAYFVRDAESPIPQFLHLYSTYMAKEKRRLDSMTDTANLTESGHLKDLAELFATLKSLHGQRKLDAYTLYLYGVVLKKLELKDMATAVFVESVHASPTLWSSWAELVTLIKQKEKLIALNLPNHWMKSFFLAHAQVDLHLNDEGLELLEDLQKSAFPNCTNITAQIAIAYHNKRNVEKAIQIFQHLQETDPYRLDHLDTFSNLLFVKDMKTEIASLAHRAVEINRFRPETCCVIGNYYSIRTDHTKAVKYFQRALKLNPQFLAAWTLMGHEFMEMKNTNAAIQSYRKAIEVDCSDYRAWYGLGQSYEILKMPFYSLYYYKIAQQLRPQDSRMLMALGEAYEKLEKNDIALKCYLKACNAGDIEAVTLWRLGNLYEKLNNTENAVRVYIEMCKDERTIVDKQSLSHVFITLGNYYDSIEKYDEAWNYANKCLTLGCNEHKQEAQALLNLVGNKRSRAHLNPISEGSKDECDEGDEEEEDDEVLMEESIMKIDSSSIQMDETNSDSE